MTRKEFFIQVLDQYATNGNELLQLLDAIETGAIQCHIIEENWALILYTFSPTLFPFYHDQRNRNRYAPHCSKRQPNVASAWHSRGWFCRVHLCRIPDDWAGSGCSNAWTDWVLMLYLGDHNPPFFRYSFRWKNATYSLSQSSHFHSWSLSLFVIAAWIPVMQITSTINVTKYKQIIDM